MLTADLQRCRRLVASMRGLVMASSLRLQLLTDAQVALAVRDERLRFKRKRTNGAPPLSPRAQYLQYRWHRTVVRKIKLEQKWRTKRGDKHFELHATTIQRMFRSYCVRKKRKNKRPLSVLAAAVLAQQQLRRERLLNDRSEYCKQINSRRLALAQAHHDLATVHKSKLATEAQIAKVAASVKTTSTLFIDSKLLDGTVVRMEAHQLLLHEMNEVDRLTETLVHLEAEIRDLEVTGDVVHQAAASIQSRFRQYRVQKNHEIVCKRQRVAAIRCRLSSEQCYARMNIGFSRRQQEAWHHSAMILDGFYHIIHAKDLAHHLRQKRAVAIIEHAYTHRRDRVDAQARIAWRRAKLRAQLFSLRRVRRVLAKCWTDWCSVVATQRDCHTRISHALANGHSKWITSKAVRLQRMFRRAMALRQSLHDHVMPTLHLVLGNLLASAVASSSQPHDQFLHFHQRVTQTMHAWRMPSKHLYRLAQRYTFPLDVLPLDEIWTWLVSQQHGTNAMGWSIDLRPPLPIRTIRFLATLSRYFHLYDQTAYQVDQIWLHYEATLCVRDYLALLYAHDAVAYLSSITTYERQHAVEWLRHEIQKDACDLDQGPTHWPLEAIAVDKPFTMFHCVWTDLCEQCLALETDRLIRNCMSCGHRHLEKSTAAQPSHAAVAQPLDESSHGKNSRAEWIKGSERCDFLVINAFYHALAPRGHGHREVYTPETLWKIALAKAYEPVSILYEQWEIRTLNDLLVQPTEHWAEALPTPVAAKLSLFLRLIKHELMAIQQKVIT